MKKTNRYISLLLALVFAAGLSSCIKEDYADSTKNDKATVSLVFDTRAPGVDGQTVQAGPNEGIKTLRVIIVDSESSTVNVNKFYDYSAEAGPVEVKTLTIMNLPVGQKDFYVIANEGSVEMNGINLDTWQEKGTFNESDKNELLQAVIASGFPKTDAEIAKRGLPIAGWQSENITGTEDQVIEIPITRAVAKMELTLTNNTGAPFQLDQVAMGSFFPNMTYLFPGKALPEGVAYADHTFETNATLAEDATETFCFYFYESYAGADAYTIQLNNGSEYGATPILVEPEEEGGQATPLTSVERNTCVRVKGTIESKAWTLLANVLPWQHEEVSFDFDDTMSYTSEGWKEGTYLLKDGNNIRLSNRMAAELNFTITAPSSLVRWTAELLEEGDGHYFEFDGSSSGEVFIGDATSAPMQTIKVRVINPDDEDYHEATLRVVATLLNGESYELDLTGEGGTAPGTAETINRYTLIQAR